MATLANRAKVTTATTGTGTITLGSAVSGFQTFAAAGVSNGATVSYVIEEGTAWEVGTGTYSSTGPTLTRTPSESSNAGAAINLAGAAQVYVTAIASDLQNAADMDQGVATTDSVTFAGATVNGNITVTGTVDGRDVAADGTKLDGIEAGATDDQTAAEIKTAYESNANTNAFTDAEQTKLAGIEASADVTDTANVTSAGALMTSGGTLTGNLSFGDNDKAIFGAGSDLEIKHDGSNSYIVDNGTGDLLLRGSNSVRIQDTGTGNNMVLADRTGPVSLFYAGSQKLATTATGVDVTGTVTADGLTVQADIPNVVIESTNAAGEAWKLQSTYNNTGGAYGSFQVRDEANNIWLRFNQNNGSDEIDLRTTNLDRLNIANNGDISFYEDTGTTPKFFWDASAEALGIGTGNPLTRFHVLNGSDSKSFFLLQGADTTTENLTFGVETGESTISAGGSGSTSNALVLRTSDSGNEVERLRITSLGNVGIGTSSPAVKLQVIGDIATNTRVAADTINGYTGGSTPLTIQTGGTQAVILGTNSTERARIDASGNLLVGRTTLPSAGWPVAVNAGITVATSDNSIQTQLFGFDGQAGVGTYTNTPFQFRVNNAERARIDASGNLLVGQTSNGIQSNGIGLVPNGTSHMYSTGTHTLELGRGISDGDILKFNRSGIDAGSIGVGTVPSTDKCLTIGKSDAGMLFDNVSNRITPWNMNTNAVLDNSIDLGYASGRFKNLYLSGSISDGTNSATVADIIAGGGAAAWVNFNGTGTASIRASDNVSSITDHGTGNYTVNFTTSLTDANYSVTACGSDVNSAYGVWVDDFTSSPTASGVRIRSGLGGSFLADGVYLNVSVFR